MKLLRAIFTLQVCLLVVGATAQTTIHPGADINSTLDIARGIVPGQTSVNKFGQTHNADNGVPTDIWDLSTQPIWLAPTAARIHAIVSNNDTDGKTGAPSSVGARTIRIYGLQTWDTKETTEDITLDGTTAVNTVNSYVIIHRIKVLTSGSSGPNVGIISATAASDGTVTAQIVAGAGQTLMAIYGVPSTQVAYMNSFYAFVGRLSPAGVDADLSLLWSSDIESQPTVFITKFTSGLERDSFQDLHHFFNPPNGFSGPGVLKLQINANANNTYADGGFDLVLVDK